MTKEGRLYQPKIIKEVMDQAGLHFTKSLGQNFLIDGNIVRQIAHAARLREEDRVLEIGPGIGTLTEELLLHAGKVLSVEIDRTFIDVLQDRFGDRDNFLLMEGDALKLDLAPVLAQAAPGRSWKLVANLPYYITAPLLERFLRTDLPIESLTVMVQKEVADRIMARPSTPDYGSLTLFVALYADPIRAFEVPRTAFMPAPKVDSTVLVLKRRPAREGELSSEDRDRVNGIIRLAFQQRRKMVIKAIQRGTGMDRRQVEEAFEARGLSTKARAENLQLEDFRHILQSLGYIKTTSKM